MVLLLFLERVEKDFVSFDTNTNGLLISTGTREQLSAFQTQYIQNKTIIVGLPSDILRSFPQAFVVFCVWPEFLWAHWCCSLCIPSFILFDSQRQTLRNPAKEGRGQTCDIFWAPRVCVTQQGSFPSEMEGAGLLLLGVRVGVWLGRAVCRQLSALPAALIPYWSHWFLGRAHSLYVFLLQVYLWNKLGKRRREKL